VISTGVKLAKPHFRVFSNFVLFSAAGFSAQAAEVPRNNGSFSHYKERVNYGFSSL